MSSPRISPFGLQSTEVERPICRPLHRRCCATAATTAGMKFSQRKLPFDGRKVQISLNVYEYFATTENTCRESNFVSITRAERAGLHHHNGRYCRNRIELTRPKSTRHRNRTRTVQTNASGRHRRRRRTQRDLLTFSTTLAGAPPPPPSTRFNRCNSRL